MLSAKTELVDFGWSRRAVEGVENKGEERWSELGRGVGDGGVEGNGTKKSGLGEGVQMTAT